MAKIMKNRKVKSSGVHMKENTQKSLPLVSGGNQKQCSMTESSQQLYPVPIYFWPTLPPPQKKTL